MSIHNSLETMTAEHRELDRLYYETSQEQKKLLHDIHAEIESALGPTPRKFHNPLKIFTDEILCAPGVRYVMLTRKSNYVDHITLSIVELRQEDDATYAYRIERDHSEKLGRVTEKTFRTPYSYLLDETERAYIWLAPDTNLLPLNGRFIEHALGRRLIAIATKLANGDARLAKIIKNNKAADVFKAKYDILNASAKALPEKFYGIEGVKTLVEAHSSLAGLIHSMDYSYDEADCSYPACRQQEHDIKAGLNAMPLDEATALFLANAQTSWTYGPRYLRAHPDLMAIAA